MIINFHQDKHININSNLKYINNNIIEKSYLDATTSCIRFKRERDFYLHCEKNSLKNVPRMYSFNNEKNTIILEFIPYEKLKINISNKNLISYFCEFINNLNDKINYSGMLTAAEAVLVKNDLIVNIEIRLNRLLNNKCIKDKFLSYYQELKNSYNSIDCNPGGLILNPSDFGMHNIIINNETHYFIDFEYAGIDSMQKAYFDFILHPKNNLLCKFDYNFKLIQEEIKHKLIYDEDQYEIVKKLYMVWWVLRLKESIEKLRKFKNNSNLINERMINIEKFENAIYYEK